MNFQPYPTRSGFVSLAIAFILGGVAIWLIKLLPLQSDLYSVFQLLVELFIVLIMFGIALYWTLVAFKLHYHLNRNGLVVTWGLARQLIPFNSIEDIIPGTELAAPAKFKGISLGGLRLGPGEIAGFGPLKFYTTAALANSLVVMTPGQAYAISPRQPESLLHAWQARQTLGPTQQWRAEIRRSWPKEGSVLVDALGLGLLVLAGLACLALFGYLAAVLPKLPPSIPIHFDAFGRADRIADKSALLMLLAAGVSILVMNALFGSLIYRWEKVTAYLLWGSTIVIQVCLLLAVLMITT